MGDYGAPLFLAWQLSNRCTGRCLHCCEESGPDKAWPDEMTREQALSLTRQIVSNGIAYVAFGGGEPMGSPWAIEIFETLTKGGVEIKIETNGLDLDDKACDKLKELKIACVQDALLFRLVVRFKSSMSLAATLLGSLRECSHTL